MGAYAALRAVESMGNHKQLTSNFLPTRGLSSMGQEKTINSSFCDPKCPVWDPSFYRHTDFPSHCHQHESNLKLLACMFGPHVVAKCAMVAHSEFFR